MIRHDAHTDFEIIREHDPADAKRPGLNFPLPVQGNQSPNALALGMIAKMSLQFGAFILVIRLIGLAYPDAALVVAHVFAMTFAVAFGIKWLAPAGGTTEWPVWLGAAIVLLFAANRHFPNLVFRTRLLGNPALEVAAPFMLQAGIALVFLVVVMAPAIKTVMATKSRESLLIGALGCFFGGGTSALGYIPESDFASWNYFAAMVVLVMSILLLITDQYIRFEIATNPNIDPSKSWPPLPKWLEVLPINHGFGILILPLSLWFGNLIFLATLPLRHASEFGLLAFLMFLATATMASSIIRNRRLSSPYVAAWDALTFWLTYNLQRNSNPNVFQCVPWFREPLVRFGTLGMTTTILSLALLHLSGVHASTGRNKVTPEEAFPFIWKTTPQNYPNVVEHFEMSKDAKAIYDRWSDALVHDGDAPLPSRKPVRYFGDLLFSIALFLFGGPLLFFFLLATTQGHFIAAHIPQDALP